MKIKILPILLILSLLCGCGFIPNDEPMTTGTTAGTTEPEEIVTPLEIPSGNDYYEMHLAALTINALNQLGYYSFRIDVVYAASFVPLENRMESKGVYIYFFSFSDQQSKIAHLYPIESDRTVPDSCTLYTPEIGYVALELVTSIPKGVCVLDGSYYFDL